MSMTDCLTPVLEAPKAIAPPLVEVSEQQFATLGMIKVVERAVRQNGPLVTLVFPGGKAMTVLGRASHAAFWQKNPDLFHKDLTQASSGVSMTRSVLGQTLLTAHQGREWDEMRREMTQLLGLSKTWFQRPLAEATQTLINDLANSPDIPVLEHCIAWATRAICEPLLAQKALDTTARDLVHRLNASFLALMSDNGASPGDDMLRHYDEVMQRFAQEHGPASIAEHILTEAGPEADQVTVMRSVVGGMLVASLHINALSLFWALIQMADQPELQQQLRDEAAKWQFNPRRVVDTPLAFATVREAQRLKPVMAFIERQLSANIELDGCELEAGQTVLFSPWLTQRNAESWADPLRFDPTRFAKGSRQLPGSYFPFGLGKRICPGTNLVNQQLTFAISTVALNLSLSPAPQTRPGDLAPMFRVNLEPRGPVTLQANPA